MIRAEDLRADACRTVPASADVSAGLERVVIPASRDATFVHVGPLPDLPLAWHEFTGRTLGDAGLDRKAGIASERYLEDPGKTPPETTRTGLAVPI